MFVNYSRIVVTQVIILDNIKCIVYGTIKIKQLYHTADADIRKEIEVNGCLIT